jgi:hypothetical protein
MRESAGVRGGESYSLEGLRGRARSDRAAPRPTTPITDAQPNGLKNSQPTRSRCPTASRIESALPIASAASSTV